MKKVTPILLFLLLLVIFLIGVIPGQAVSLEGRGGVTKELAEVGVAEAIGTVIKLLLSLVGAVALIAFLYGGYVWLTSAGIGERINQGKTILIWALIGLILVLFSYVAVDFVIYALVGESTPLVTEASPTPPLPPQPPVLPACSNGIDDDNDTKIDFPDDPGCENETDENEFNEPLKQCSDTIDNDGDGLIDYPNDPECDDVNDDSEAPEPPPVLPPTCKWLEPAWPYDCESAGFHCVDCPSWPNADGGNEACAEEAYLKGKNLYSAIQGTCHVCTGMYIGCAKGQACCCYGCEVDLRLSEVKEENFDCWSAMCKTGQRSYLNLCGRTNEQAQSCIKAPIFP